jgi:RHS repeat-associated protein
MGSIWADVTTTNTLLARYVYGDGVDQVWARAIPAGLTNSGVAWYLTDREGSVRDIMNASSVIVDHADYDGFGNATHTTLSVADQFGYAGGLYSYDTKMEQFGARWYDAATGRWVSEDPSGFGGGVNLYAYTANDPTSEVDRSGLLPQPGGYPYGADLLPVNIPAAITTYDPKDPLQWSQLERRLKGYLPNNPVRILAQLPRFQDPPFNGDCNKLFKWIKVTANSVGNRTLELVKETGDIVGNIDGILQTGGTVSVTTWTWLYERYEKMEGHLQRLEGEMVLLGALEKMFKDNCKSSNKNLPNALAPQTNQAANYATNVVGEQQKIRDFLSIKPPGPEAPLTSDYWPLVIVAGAYTGVGTGVGGGIASAATQSTASKPSAAQPCQKPPTPVLQPVGPR